MEVKIPLSLLFYSSTTSFRPFPTPPDSSHLPQIPQLFLTKAGSPQLFPPPPLHGSGFIAFSSKNGPDRMDLRAQSKQTTRRYDQIQCQRWSFDPYPTCPVCPRKNPGACAKKNKFCLMIYIYILYLIYDLICLSK